VQSASKEIMAACVAAGGSITGEHGVGSDKLEYMPLLFDEATLAAMCDVRRGFDPDGRANPGKVVPLRSCREWRAGRVQ
jgi:FAD/FMN-containing dehydrogenase